MDRTTLFVLIVAFLAVLPVFAADPVGIVTHVKVLSDKVPDVSSQEAWQASFIKEGMTDQEKAIAVWQSVIMFQYQETPPNEFLQHEDAVYDPIKMFNVYGYAMCSPHSAHMCALARSIGMGARCWAVNHHSICEFNYGNAWHHLDSSLVCYFLKDDGVIASVAELTAAAQEWYKQNPDYTDPSTQDKMLRALERTDGRKGWQTKGPKLIANSPSYDARGWWPAGTHGWYATMEVFDGSAGPGNKAYNYEYCASMGYQVNIELRAGETITRNWSHKGLHVNMDGTGGTPGNLEDKEGFLKKQQAFVDKTVPAWPNLANGRIGNGTHFYDVPLADGRFRHSALRADNLTFRAEDRRGPALHVKNPATPGVLEIRMPSSYVYLSGTLEANAVVGAKGGIMIELSDNHGRSWKSVASIAASGTQTISLKDLVYRRYDYRLRITLNGVGTGLDTLRITHDIQHSQRPLPALAQGANTITFSAGGNESTLTIEANNKADHKGRQVTYNDFGVTLNGVKPEGLVLAAAGGTVTVPVAVPGELKRLRMCACYRTWNDKARWDIEVSFDGGATFIKAGQGIPQDRGRQTYIVFDKVPANTKEALVRFAGTEPGCNQLGSFRIDADYTNPAIGFMPVKITYQWEENGAAKEDVHIAVRAQDTYKITCGVKPVMKAIVLETAEQ